MNEPISEVIRPRRRTKRALQRKQVLVEKYVVEGMSQLMLKHVRKSKCGITKKAIVAEGKRKKKAAVGLHFLRLAFRSNRTFATGSKNLLTDICREGMIG
jgi:hypothetical protein